MMALTVFFGCPEILKYEETYLRNPETQKNLASGKGWQAQDGVYEDVDEWGHVGEASL